MASHLLPILFLSTFLLPATAIDIVAGESNFIKTTFAKRTLRSTKISHIHFYFHDTLSGRSPSAVTIIKPPSPSQSFFGLVAIIDDLLTEGPESESKPVGRAQGIYASAAQEEVGLLMAMNLYFTEGRYNGSVLSVLGRNAAFHPVREMPIVGGSGLFRFARGYAVARTHWLDFKSGDAIVEYNVTVMHY